MKTFCKAAAIALAMLCALATARRTQAQSAPCDRACLIQTTNIYLAGLVAHDPTIVKWATDVKFVENTVPMKPGEGLWKTASAIPTTFKIYVPDPVAQQIGFLGMMQENDRPIELALRLKLVDGQITEAEHLIAQPRHDEPGESCGRAARVLGESSGGFAFTTRRDAENRSVVLRGAGDRGRQ